MQRASEFDFATAAPRQTASSGIFAMMSNRSRSSARIRWLRSEAARQRRARRPIVPLIQRTT